MKLSLFFLLVLAVPLAYTVEIDQEKNQATLDSVYGNITLYPFKAVYPSFLEDPPEMDYRISFCAYENLVTINAFCGIFNETIDGDAGILKTTTGKITQSYTCGGTQYGKINDTAYWCYVNSTNYTIPVSAENWVNVPTKTVYWNETTSETKWTSLKQYISHEAIEEKHYYCFEKETTIQPYTCKEFYYSVDPTAREGKWDYYLDTSVGELLIDPTWYDSSWDFKRSCEINSTVSSTLTNFPAYCIIDTATLITEGKIQNDCDDLIVTNSSEDGLLKHEIENCNATNTVVWLGIPSLAGETNYTAYLYYGNDEATNSEDTSLWTDANYIRVYHFDEASFSGTASDSSGTSDATYTGTAALQSTNTDLRGKYINFTTAGVGNYVSGTNPGSWSSTNKTVTFLLLWNGTLKDFASPWSTYISAGGPKSDLTSPTGKLRSCGIDGCAAIIETDNAFPSNSVISVAQAFWYSGGTNHSLFTEGELNATSATGGVNNGNGFKIGNDWNGADRTWAGLIDEFRVASVSRSSDWLFAEANMLSTLGNEETGNGLTDCRVLNESGVYTLINDITMTGAGSCFSFNDAGSNPGHDITLDCDGYTISGDGTASSYAARVYTDYNITIQNCPAIWGFEHGISIESSSYNVTLDNVTINGTNPTVSCIDIWGDNHDVIINNSEITNCGDYGIWMGNGPDNITIANTEIHDTTDHGINLGSDASSTNISLDNVTIHDTGGDGLYIANSNLVNIANSNFYNNPHWGIYHTESSNNTYSDNVIYNNSYGGIYFYNSTNTTFTEDQIYNETIGLEIVGETGSAINLTNVYFDRPQGDFSNFTNLSLNDSLAASDDYSITYMTTPATLPTGYTSIGNWINLTDLGGSPSIDSIVWHYLDADIPAGISEGTLDIWKYSGSWEQQLAALDTSANTISLEDISSFSGWGPLGSPFEINASDSAGFETTNNTFYLNISGSAETGNITEYQIQLWYNDTLAYTVSRGEINNLTIYETLYAVAPLVQTNLTNISYHYIALLNASSEYNLTIQGEHTVYTWYDGTGYATDWGETIEAPRNVTVDTFPSEPAGAIEAVTYPDGAYTLYNCTRVHADASEDTVDCENSITDINSTYFQINADHLKEDEIIYQDYYVNGTLTLYYDATDEAESYKTVNVEFADNSSREYFVWIVNSTNGTIDGADNISDILNITFYDEQTLDQINVSAASLVYVVTFDDGETKNFSIVYTGDIENVFIRGYPDSYTSDFSAEELYTQTGYAATHRYTDHETKPFNVLENVSIYLLNSSIGQYYTFTVMDQYGLVLPDVTITASRFVPALGEYIVTETGITDYTGVTNLFLEPYNPYSFSVEAEGFDTLNFEFVPAADTTITIILTRPSTTTVTLPTFDHVWNNVSYSILPDNYSFSPTDINISYVISSPNGSLEYYGINITKKYNGTLAAVYTQNITSSATGGSLTYQTNGTGVYTVTTWFKAENYSLFYPAHRIYYIGNATGLAAAREKLIEDEPISGWVYYLIAVVVAMLVAGFVSNYTVEGAGAVGLIILWGFTWLYPSAEIIPELGITTFLATCLTTLMVIAGIYVMRQGL